MSLCCDVRHTFTNSNVAFVAVVRVQQLEYQLRAQQANNTTLNTSIAALNADNTTLKSGNASLKAHNTILNDTITSLQSKLATRTNQMQALQAQVNNLVNDQVRGCLPSSNCDCTLYLSVMAMPHFHCSSII